MSNLVRETSDGSFIDAGGRILFFSIERFIRDIVQGDCCFICGVEPGRTAFNDEHVVPRWILREFQLFDRWIGLPNGTDFRYGQYTLPCCRTCNAEMGEIFEQPIRQAMLSSSSSFNDWVSAEGPFPLFCWLSLLFLKTHLKSARLRLSRDKMSGDLRKISSLFDLGPLHHIHAVARSFHTRATLRREAFGSLIVLPVGGDEALRESFDFLDLHISSSIMLRVHDVGIVAALCDSNAALSVFLPQLKKIDGPVSAVQLREIFGTVSFLAANLKQQPVFSTRLEGDRPVIACERPNLEFNELSCPTRGQILWPLVKDFIKHHPSAETIAQQIHEGRWTFLFGPDGKLIRDSIKPLIS